MLHTLEVSGYIERDPSGRYCVSADLRAWGREQLVTDLVDAASGPMRELSREFGETVSLAMRFENRIEVVATIESPQLIRMGNTVGRILPPHASSLGKAITAHQTEDVRERLIRSYGITRSRAHDHRRSGAQARIRARARARLQHRRRGERPRRPLLRRADLRTGTRGVRGDQPVAAEDARPRQADRRSPRVGAAPHDEQIGGSLSGSAAGKSAPDALREVQALGAC